MFKIKWLGLQLFGGEGGAGSAGTGEGGGDSGAATGAESSAAAGQSYEDRLRARGVPEDKIRKRANKSEPKPANAAPATQEAAQTQQDAAAETTTEEPKQDTPARMSWDEIMKDPEYNAEMQKVVQSRLRNAKADQETLTKMGPALELLAKKYNLDAGNMDYDALAKAISDDDDYYEDKALEMGVSVETAKKIEQQAAENARLQAQHQQTLEQQKIQQHIQRMEQQGEALKQTFPSFDLRTELQNPVFARMTSPNVGISVEDAYYAIHRKEIQTAAMQVTAQKAAQKISNSIQAGQNRPAENGTSGQAPSVTTFDYSKASNEQRDAFKKDLRARWARGEKVYPGRR